MKPPPMTPPITIPRLTFNRDASLLLGGGEGGGGLGRGGDGDGGGGDGGGKGRGGAAAIIAEMNPYDEDNVAEDANTFAGTKFSVCLNASLAAKAVDGKYTTVDTTALPAE
jgi:hypothetical protein